MRRAMDQSDVDKLLKKGWVVLAGEYRRGKLRLRQPKIVYKITFEGMVNYMAIIKVLGEPKGILKGRGVDYIDSVSEQKITKQMIEQAKSKLINDKLLVETADRVELSETGFIFIKTMFQLEGKSKIDWNKTKASGNKADKFNKGMFMAIKGITKVMEAGQKMDKQFNGGSKRKGQKRYKQKKTKRFEDDWDYGKPGSF